MLLAIDVALLPPPEIVRRAIELSAALPEHESQGLRLGDHALPHITLTQQFIREADLPGVAGCVAMTIAGVAPLELTITGSGRGSRTLWMVLAKTSQLADLHLRLMDASQRYEQPAGAAVAFAHGDARLRDVEWVNRFRRESAYEQFTPHITLGHGTEAPLVEPTTFTARTIAVCHLGKFCTCRHVFQRFVLTGT